MPSGFTLCTADSHCAPQLSLGVQRSQSSGDVHHDLTPAALADAARADKLPDAAIATEDVMSQAAQHGSDDEDELVKLQITIGLAARKSVVIKVDADASVGQIKARLKQVVDVDSTVDWSKLDFSKLDLIIGMSANRLHLRRRTACNAEVDNHVRLPHGRDVLAGVVAANIDSVMAPNRPVVPADPAAANIGIVMAPHVSGVPVVPAANIDAPHVPVVQMVPAAVGIWPAILRIASRRCDLGVPSVDLDESSASRGSQEETDDYTSETDSDRQSGAESDDNCSLAGVREEPHAPTGCRICKRCFVCAIHHQLNHQVGKTPEDATSCAMGCHYIHPKRRFCSTCIYKGNLHPL